MQKHLLIIELNLDKALVRRTRKMFDLSGWMLRKMATSLIWKPRQDTQISRRIYGNTRNYKVPIIPDLSPN